MRISWLLVAGSALTLAQAVNAQERPVQSTRAGKRAMLPRETQIALARSAAPASVSDKATILVRTDTGYARAVVGTNGVTCLVEHSWRDSIEPHCYDAEGARTALRSEYRRLQLREAGKSEDVVARTIAKEVASGSLRLPKRLAVSYMMSAGQLLYNDDGKSTGAVPSHLMIYYPNLTNAAVGLGEGFEMQVGMVMDAGHPGSNLVIVMGSSVPVAGSPAGATGASH